MYGNGKLLRGNERCDFVNLPLTTTTRVALGVFLPHVSNA
jgi:hypothetical protein